MLSGCDLGSPADGSVVTAVKVLEMNGLPETSACCGQVPLPSDTKQGVSSQSEDRAWTSGEAALLGPLVSLAGGRSFMTS